MQGGGRTRGEEWETREGWEREVARPVHRYMMAPREARDILEAAGRLMARGVSAQEVVDALDDLLGQPPDPRPPRRPSRPR